MIRGMKFLLKDSDNLDELTPNTIFMCDSSEVKDIVCNCIHNSYIAKTERSVRFNDGVDWIEDVECNCNMDFPQTTIFEFNKELNITVTVENAFVFSMKNPYDLWFVRKRNESVIFIPFSNFKNYETYDSISLYKALTVGRFSINGEYRR